MEYIILLITVLSVHLLALVSPGPDFVVALSQSMRYGRKTGYWTAVGFGLGIFVHILYSVAGIAFVISQSIVLFTLIKFVGALYLIYIGYKAIRVKSSSIDIKENKKIDYTPKPLSAIKTGFLTNVLNPKATLFFLTLFSVVLSPTTPAWFVWLAGILMVLNTIIWFCLISWLFTNKTIREQFLRYEDVFNKIFGSILIALGLRVATENK